MAGFPSEHGRGLFWYVHNGAHWQCGPGYGCDRKAFFAHQIMFTVKGQGTGTYEGRPFSAGPDSAVLMDLARPHSYWADPRDPWEMYWVRFDGPGVAALFEALLRAHGSPVFPVVSAQRMSAEFEALFGLLREQPQGYEAWIWHRLTGLMALVVEALRGEGAQAGAHLEHAPSSIAPALKLLRDRHRETIALEELARAAHLSMFHFLRRFKHATGFTPMEYLEKFRVSRAQELMLSQPELRLKDVAQLVGYPDPAYFSRVFRKRTGQSPRQFRSSLSG